MSVSKSYFQISLRARNDQLASWVSNHLSIRLEPWHHRRFKLLTAGLWIPQCSRREAQICWHKLQLWISEESGYSTRNGAGRSLVQGKIFTWNELSLICCSDANHMSVWDPQRNQLHIEAIISINITASSADRWRLQQSLRYGSLTCLVSPHLVQCFFLSPFLLCSSAPWDVEKCLHWRMAQINCRANFRLNHMSLFIQGKPALIALMRPTEGLLDTKGFLEVSMWECN